MKPEITYSESLCQVLVREAVLAERARCLAVLDNCNHHDDCEHCVDGVKNGRAADRHCGPDSEPRRWINIGGPPEERREPWCASVAEAVEKYGKNITCRLLTGVHEFVEERKRR